MNLIQLLHATVHNSNAKIDTQRTERRKYSQHDWHLQKYTYKST